MENADSVDHIIPHAKGGTDDPSNLQAAHMTCNKSKNAHMQGGVVPLPRPSRFD